MAKLQQVIDTDTQEVLSTRLIHKNKNFIQLSEIYMQTFIKLNTENSSGFNFFMFLLDKMDRRNAILISRDTLAALFNVKVLTISRWTRWCKDKKLIDVVKSGSSNIYCVNSNLAWKAGADKKHYAKFTTEVIVSKEEQETEHNYYKQIDLTESSKDEYKSNIALAKHLKNEKGE